MTRSWPWREGVGLGRLLGVGGSAGLGGSSPLGLEVGGGRTLGQSLGGTGSGWSAAFGLAVGSSGGLHGMKRLVG